MQVNAPSILQSKKFGAAALASILSFVSIHYGLSLEQVALVTAPLYAYIGGQSLADIGKERAKVENGKAPTATINVAPPTTPT